MSRVGVGFCSPIGEGHVEQAGPNVETYGYLTHINGLSDASLFTASNMEITAEGRSHVEELLPELHQVERRWMACLSGDEQQLLLQMLTKLQANEPCGSID